jgi:UDP-2-acetamido-2-deoxy-ribo-hexuluronate aminotransferase
LGSQNLIPFFGVSRQYENLRDEILNASDIVYRSGKVLDGEFTNEFERRIAARCDRQFAVSVNSGTQALIFVLQHLGPVGEVIIPDISFIATLNSVMMTEHIPRIVDVDHAGLLDLPNATDTLNDDAIRAIMYVNLYGNIIDYDKLRVMADFWGKSPMIIEDAAQSFGGRYKGIPSGKLGDVSILSFDPTKNLNNYGSGGMILTDDYDLCDSVINFRDNGKHSGHCLPGTNSKMSESDCAQMLVKLQYFDDWQARRTEIANYYCERMLPFVDVLTPNENVEHAWHKFVIRCIARSKLQNHLTSKGIETKIHYAEPLHMSALAQSYTTLSEESNSYALSKSCLSLPIYPELTDSEVEYIADSVTSFFR